MKNKIALGLCSIAVGVLMSGCVVEGPPPPAMAVEVYPDYYAWDGYEYVGIVGDQYYYLGSGNVWIVCDPVRRERFHGWVNTHPDRRTHATVNVQFHGNAPGHEPKSHAAPAHRKDDRYHGHGDDWQH